MINLSLTKLLKITLPLLVLALAGISAYALIKNRPEVQTQLPLIRLPGVQVYEVELQDLALTVQSQGTVGPRTESQLVPEISGRVMRVSPSFAAGGFFESGDILLEIDSYNYEQALIAAQAQLAQARLRLAREEAEATVARREWEELGSGPALALTLHEPQLEDANAAVTAAEASLNMAKRDLTRAKITAPYAGRVRRKNVDVGQFVTIGNPIATIYAIDYAEIRLPLPDEELAYLDVPLSYRGGQNRPGPNVTIRANFAGRTHEWLGSIVRTESEIDSESRMVHVVAQVSDPYAPSDERDRPPLAVGMYVEAEIEGRVVQNVSMLPRAALRGSNQIYIVDGEGRLRFRTVEIFRTTTEAVIVRAGLEVGTLVVISALDAVTDGMKVQVVQRPDPIEEEL